MRASISQNAPVVHTSILVLVVVRHTINTREKDEISCEL
jgi:hypothetical protein